MSTNPLLGQIIMFGGNFAIRGWAFCDGQLLPISQNTALFSILGTTYGGDGETTFGIPELRGRVPIGPRQGPGLPNYSLGQRSGLVTTTLNLSNLANHGHLVSGHLGVSEEDANTTDAEGNALAGSAAHNMYVNAPPEVDLAENSVGGTSGLTGNNQAFNNRQPYLGLNFIISTSGQYPSRN